nr:MAG TPA: hypothetical protein [Caudoviricetes sp.]
MNISAKAMNKIKLAMRDYKSRNGRCGRSSSGHSGG